MTTDEPETREEVLDRHVAKPKTEVEIIPEWEEYPEERPGENLHIEDNTLHWERDGFAVALESYETTHWRAEIDIPEDIGRWYPREIDLKCHPKPEYGYVDETTIEDYHTVGATVVISANMQPVYEVQAFIDSLLEAAEESEQFTEEISEKLEQVDG